MDQLTTRLNKQIEIFDLDGTLTKIGYSFWNLITRALVVNVADFDSVALHWKAMILEPTTTNKQTFFNILKHTAAFNPYWNNLAEMAMEGDKIQSSLAMTEIGILMLHEAARNSQALIQTAQKITQEFPEYAIIIDAINYLKYRLEQGVTCIISTASYEEGAKGFVAGLVDLNLLTQELAQKIKFSGTRTNWQTSKVTHMNVGKNKLFGLEQLFSVELGAAVAIEQLKPRILAVFGDDPEINDRSLLRGLCQHCFVIKNANNVTMQLPSECVLASWADIYANKENLKAWHSELKQKGF